MYQRQFEQDILDSDLRVFLEFLPDALIEIDLSQTVTYMNRMAFVLFGFTQNDFKKGIKAEQLFPKEEYDRAKRIIDNYVTEGRSESVGYTRSGTQELLEFRMKRKDGSEIYTEAQSSFVLDNQNNPIKLRTIIRDITERKQVEADKEQSRSLLKAALESTADGILVVARDGHWSSFNQKFVDMWGIPTSISESGDDKAALDYVIDSLAEPDEFLAKVSELYDDLERDSFDTIKMKDGRIFERYSQPQWLKEEVVGRVWSFRDITERKQAEKKIRQQQEELQIILDSMPALVFYKDKEDRFIHVNKALAQAFNMSKEELIGKSAAELSPVKDYWEDDKKVMESGIPSRNIIEPMETPEGTAWVKTDKIPYEDNDGNIAGIIGFAVDITKQKKEEKLQSVLYGISRAVSTTTNLDELYQAIHNQLAKVIDTTNFFIALIDENENTMSFPYYVDEFDSPPEPIELPKKLISEYVIETGMPLYFKEKDIIELAETGAIDLDYSGTISKVWLGAPLQLKNKSIGVIVVQSYHDPDLYSESDLDILNFVSEQVAIAITRKQVDEFTRASEKKYRLLSGQLAEANILKELLLDVITHDIKNPAGVISSIAEMMVEEQFDHEMVEIIKGSSDKLLRVMDNATTLAQVTIGDKIDFEELNLAEVLHSIGKGFSSQLKQLDMTLKIDIPDKLLLKANPIISEVFSNYISNAIKYATEGKKILIDSEKRKGILTINVKDFGSTIPVEHRQKVFDRTYQIDGKKRGRGLGLAIVKRIAEAHNVEVGVKPNEPTGNIFYIKIPTK